MKEQDTDPFVENLRTRFEHSVDALDAATLSAINRARYRALEGAGSARPARIDWLPAGALAGVCLAVLVYSLIPRTPVEEKTFIDEVEIISELDLYENLEFYEWLEQNEIPS
jgi:hypothetical protein